MVCVKPGALCIKHLVNAIYSVGLPLSRRLAPRILTQQRHKLAARDLAGAQGRQVRAGHLAVDDFDVACATLLDQTRQCHLRGIALQTEHRLAEEYLS